MSSRNKLILLIFLILFGGILWSRFVNVALEVGVPPKEEYLPPGPVPDFTLTESRGSKLTRQDLLGKIWVANLMFTSCGDTCPIQSGTMSKLDQALGARDDVRLVSITITPEYDQPPRLREYAERYHASDKWLFLTGDRTVITKLANEGFWLSAGSPGTVTHSDKFVLIDREGHVRGFYDGLKAETVPVLVKAIDAMKGAK